MLVATLNGTHPTYNAALWTKYDALYRGGDAFRAKIDEMLPRNPEEPGEVYACRCKEASYRSYVAPIVNFFAAKLFSSPFDARPKASKPAKAGGSKKADDLDPFWASWKEDVTGAGVDLIDFARARLTSAFVKGRSWWLVERPEVDEEEGAAPINRAQYVEAGLDKPYLCPLENEQVLDFEVDRRGELVWAIVHDLAFERPSPALPRKQWRETWRIYDATNVSTYEIVYDPTNGGAIPENATLVGAPKPHGFSRVPLVRCGFVGAKGVRAKVGKKNISVSGEQIEGLWLVNSIADAQIAHFRLTNALTWNIKRTCYAMPVFTVVDADKPPTMGAGYYIMIGLGESVEWVGPPTDHLDLMSKEIAAQKDEIYRLANQMANGIDNNAAAVGRSGESKAVDNANAEVCLSVYGAIIKEALEQTYQLVSDARGEDHEWSVEGLDTFDLDAVSDVLAHAKDTTLLNIPSKTLKKELFNGVAKAVVPHISQETKETIKKEIDEGVEEAAKAPPPAPPLQPAVSPPVGEATPPPAAGGVFGGGAKPFGHAAPQPAPPGASAPPKTAAA